MNFNSIRNSIASLLPCGMAGLLSLLLSPAPLRAAERQVLRGHVPAAALGLPAPDRLAAGQRLHLAIGLPLRDPAGLARLLRELYDPASPNCRRFLTPEQFAERFGPAEEDYQAVIAFAKANGLKVTATHPNRVLLDVEGAVADIEKAFRINLRIYPHPTEPRNFFAPDTEPSLDLEVPVLGIGGLDDFSPPRPLRRKAFFESDANARAYATGSGPRGYFIGRDYRAAYAPDVPLDGAGESVGIFALDGYYPDDIAEHARLAGLPNIPLTNVLLSGVSGLPGYLNSETSMDIALAISMAPGLERVIVYEGRDTTPNDILNRMATDNLARQLSSSWGVGNWGADPVRWQIFCQFAAQGQSFLQASGDEGTWTNGVYPPSDLPLATIVGGTELSVSEPGGAWLAEDTAPFSGGGVSTNYAIPWWQQGFDLSACQGSTVRRNIPDVASVADLIWVVVDNGDLTAAYGTSAATPLWAGFAALANQQAAAEGQPPLGFLNPALYAVGKGPGRAAAFHDITTGNNTNSGSANKFFAVPGYDLCTGWGSPAGSNLIFALLAPPAALGLAPAAPLVFSGPAGGPFTPASQAWSLTNQTAAPFDWTLTSPVPAPWLEIAPTGGTLAPGGPGAAVSVVLNATAATLPAGSYTNTLWFTNLNDPFGQSREVILDVVAPPLIVSQPAGQSVPEGSAVSFAAGVANPASAVFQWRFDDPADPTGPAELTDGGGISGATTATLTISHVSPANAGVYSVIVSNAAGAATSSNATLAVVPSPPVFTLHPTNRTVLPGETVTLHAGVVGSQPRPCRWVRNLAFLYDGGNISGATTPALTLSNVSGADAGTYFLMAGNPLGVVAGSNAVLTVVSVTAPGIGLATLHSFGGGGDGSHPNGLAPGGGGRFLGTARHGGAHLAGTVFELSASGAVTGLHSFTGTNDGSTPLAALAPEPDGGFLGSTFQGGLFDNGTLFRITSAGALATVVHFNITNGDFPYAALTPGADANYYGTSYQGGANARGTVFQLAADGALTVLQHFANGPDGGHVAAGLVPWDDGSLYGVTFKGGNYSKGTAFQILTNGIWTRLLSFDGANGSHPVGTLARGEDGNFYGATTRGGAQNLGTIFRLTPRGVLTSLYSFTGGSDGANPRAALLPGSDGNFYGTTADGGDYGRGTLFRLTPGGTVTPLAAFEGWNGANPQAALVEDANGAIYGAALNGGAHGLGTLFRLDRSPAAPEITGQPASQLAFAGDEVRFSVAVTGLPTYQWRKNGTNLVDSPAVSGSNGRLLILSNVSLADAGTYSVMVTNAFGSATSAGAFLTVTSTPPFFVQQPTNQTFAPGGRATFAATALGNPPLSYQWRKHGTNLADGGRVFGSASETLFVLGATEPDSGTYFVTVSNGLGSADSSNAVLSVIPDSAPNTRLATVSWFGNGAGGGVPNGLARGTNGSLYGTTRSGGAWQQGTVFRLTPDGTLTTLASFDGTNGSAPWAAPVQAADGAFYGATRFGGSQDQGVVYRLADGGALTNLHSFTGGGDGGHPFVPLAPGADGLYGTARDGGAYGCGAVFRIAPGGALEALYSFTNGLDGAFPSNGLVPGVDGIFYGTTGGGAFGCGNVFALSPDGAFTVLHQFNGEDGREPVGELVQGADGKFYGATKHNRSARFELNGLVFSLVPGGAPATLYWLNSNDGFRPAAGLLAASDGNFYGTTYTDGERGYGTVFRITPAGGSISNLVWLDGFNTGAFPEAALVEAADGSLYGTTTSGGLGGWGTIFRLTYTNAPYFTLQPASQVVLLGQDTALRAAAAGAPPLHFQWRKNGTNLPGSTNFILLFTNSGLADSGTYSVTVSNALGMVTSGNAVFSAVTKPVILSVRIATNSVRLTWSAMPGKQYRLQYKTSLTAPIWIPTGSTLTATTNTVTTSDPVATAAQRFYRVALLP